MNLTEEDYSKIMQTIVKLDKAMTMLREQAYYDYTENIDKEAKKAIKEIDKFKFELIKRYLA